MGLNDPVPDLAELPVVAGGVPKLVLVLTHTPLDACAGSDQLTEVFLCAGVIGPQDRLKLAIIEDDPSVIFAVDSIQLRNTLDHQANIHILAPQCCQGGGDHLQLAEPGKLVHQQQGLDIMRPLGAVHLRSAFQMPNQLGVHQIDRAPPLLDLVCWDAQKDVEVVEVIIHAASENQ